jgi:hypothetical protein
MGLLDNDLILVPTGSLQVDCYVDADFSGVWSHKDKLDLVCEKSRTGFVAKLAKCTVIWGSHLQ